jgi:predicted nucleic acid-binding protein
MAGRIFLDTGALYAYFDKSDAEHKKVTAFIDSSDCDFYTSNFIIDEIITLLRCRNFKVSYIKPFIDELRQESFSTILYITPEIEELAWQFMNK